MTFSWSLYLGLVGLAILIGYGVWRRRRVSLFRFDVLEMQRRANDWANRNDAQDDKGFIALNRVLSYAAGHPERLVLFDVLMIVIAGHVYRNLTLPDVDQSLLDCVRPEAPLEIKIIALAFGFRAGIYMCAESVSGFLSLGLFLILGRLLNLSRFVPSVKDEAGVFALVRVALTGSKSTERVVAIR